MIPEAYRKTLIEAATEIHKLLVEHSAIFLEKVQKFVALFEQWRDAVVEGQGVALEHTKPELAFYSGDDIPETFKLPKGCEHYKLYELLEFYHTDKSLPLNEHNEKLPFKGKHKDRNVRKRRHVYYGPPLPLNPMDTLRLRNWPCLPFESGSGLYEKDPRDPEEDLLRKFFLLAVIHAFYSHGQPIIDRDSLAAQLVLEAYRHEDDNCVPDKQSLIDTALIDVRAYIESNSKSQREDGQGEETTKKSESRVLCEIADKLSAWRESVPGDKKKPGNWITAKLTKEGHDAAIESLRLLHKNSDLLHYCKERFHFDYREAEKAFDTLKSILSGIEENNIPAESYVNWGHIIALSGFINELKRWANMLRQGKTEGKEQLWDEKNTDYMGTTEAAKVAKDKGRKISPATLGRKLTPDGPMRYMRKYTDETNTKYTRTRVHIGDFRKYMMILPILRDEFSEDAFNERQSKIEAEKKTQGKLPDINDGYNKLAKKIYKQ